jgi:hypothetical protein
MRHKIYLTETRKQRIYDTRNHKAAKFHDFLTKFRLSRTPVHVV